MKFNSVILASALTQLVVCALLFRGHAVKAATQDFFAPQEMNPIEPTSADVAPAAAVTKSEAEWQQQLTPAQFAVMRKHATERTGSSPLLHEHRRGVFRCVACGAPLFATDATFESGTGWPSFTKPFIAANIATSEDRSFFATRTEVHCARCGAHLGHVFDDGPPPTGLRYCMNGVALKFEPRP